MRRIVSGLLIVGAVQSYSFEELEGFPVLVNYKGSDSTVFEIPKLDFISEQENPPFEGLFTCFYDHSYKYGFTINISNLKWGETKYSNFEDRFKDLKGIFKKFPRISNTNFIPEKTSYQKIYSLLLKLIQ